MSLIDFLFFLLLIALLGNSKFLYAALLTAVYLMYPQEVEEVAILIHHFEVIGYV